MFAIFSVSMKQLNNMRNYEITYSNYVLNLKINHYLASILSSSEMNYNNLDQLQYHLKRSE